MSTYKVEYSRLIRPQFFCPENVVYFLSLLHIFKSTSDKIFSWQQALGTQGQSDLGHFDCIMLLRT